ncbi:MAG: DUF3084 domain-containing protein [Cyanobacteria bacterium]|nr:DUF3084 domain-containing protein [Cyanobacteria bacterium CG_2015-16_32_12]NCO78507.1 DUF3084 domain-containing protein [Cyanobacteria bacterium CG_2015-22_32_23]NCQ04851.1 DUF3084 domain-containing protein [Cyanobacteria bacterium CG_2015-09_32_10]NCQ42479.1 DUF3084 domain-containing protein [Cyanobacteria bacterium CG_2015-04_32_10]NCS85624.1 DUF3084 domain-containing protein [Cyanobacteria bacterium CG_2015-02_32_10]
MTSAYILVAAMLILGGLIAALGDRIGTKVGKARLRLFQLRPKQTAIVITISTGILISASTLIILFSFSESLRQGVFELDEILKKRREITAQLEKVEREKKRVEQELSIAQNRQNQEKKLLNITGKELKTTQNQLKILSAQTDKINEEVKKIVEEKTKLLAEKEQLENQSKKLEESIVQRDNDLNNKRIQIQEQENILVKQDRILQKQEQSLVDLKNKQSQLQSDIKSRDQQISKLDQRISEKDKILNTKEQELLSLEKELGFFRKEVEILEQYYQTYQDLRERPIAVVKGQILNLTLVKTDKTTNLDELIDGILNEANRGVMQILGYGNNFPDQRFVQITKAQVQQIKTELSDNGEYLIRIVSAGNYVQGEEKVRIFADVSPNKKVYDKNETIASIAMDSNDLNGKELQEKLDFLISVAQFRARQEGLLGQIIIGDGKIISLINFVQNLKLTNQSIDEILAVAAKETNASGPLQINLVVIADGKEILKL